MGSACGTVVGIVYASKIRMQAWLTLVGCMMLGVHARPPRAGSRGPETDGGHTSSFLWRVQEPEPYHRPRASQDSWQPQANHHWSDRVISSRPEHSQGDHSSYVPPLVQGSENSQPSWQSLPNRSSALQSGDQGQAPSQQEVQPQQSFLYDRPGVNTEHFLASILNRGLLSLLTSHQPSQNHHQQSQGLHQQSQNQHQSQSLHQQSQTSPPHSQSHQQPQSHHHQHDLFKYVSNLKDYKPDPPKVSSPWVRYKPHTPQKTQPEPVEPTAERGVPESQSFSGYFYKTEAMDVVPEYTVSPRLRPMAVVKPRPENPHVKFPNFMQKYDPEPAEKTDIKQPERTQEPEYHGSPRLGPIHLRKPQPEHEVKEPQEERTQYSHLTQSDAHAPASLQELPSSPEQIENQLDNMLNVRDRLYPTASQLEEPLPLQEPEYQGSPRLRPLHLSRPEPEALDSQELPKPEEDSSRYNYWHNSNTHTYEALSGASQETPLATPPQETNVHANFPNYIHKHDQQSGMVNQDTVLEPVQNVWQGHVTQEERAQYRPNPRHPQQLQYPEPLNNEDGRGGSFLMQESSEPERYMRPLSAASQQESTPQDLHLSPLDGILGGDAPAARDDDTAASPAVDPPLPYVQLPDSSELREQDPIYTSFMYRGGGGGEREEEPATGQPVRQESARDPDPQAVGGEEGVIEASRYPSGALRKVDIVNPPMEPAASERDTSEAHRRPAAPGVDQKETDSAAAADSSNNVVKVPRPVDLCVKYQTPIINTVRLLDNKDKAGYLALRESVDDLNMFDYCTEMLFAREEVAPLATGLGQDQRDGKFFNIDLGKLLGDLDNKLFKNKYKNKSKKQNNDPFDEDEWYGDWNDDSFCRPRAFCRRCSRRGSCCRRYCERMYYDMDVEYYSRRPEYCDKNNSSDRCRKCRHCYCNELF